MRRLDAGCPGKEKETPAGKLSGLCRPGQTEPLQPLNCFFTRIRHDPRIGLSHIALYAALFRCWVAGGASGPVSAFSYELMPVAKICSSATYHRVLRELDAYGYLRYEPSYSRLRRSRVFLGEVG